MERFDTFFRQTMESISVGDIYASSPVPTGGTREDCRPCAGEHGGSCKQSDWYAAGDSRPIMGSPSCRKKKRRKKRKGKKK